MCQRYLANTASHCKFKVQFRCQTIDGFCKKSVAIASEYFVRTVHPNYTTNTVFLINTVHINIVFILQCILMIQQIIISLLIILANYSFHGDTIVVNSILFKLFYLTAH